MFKTFFILFFLFITEMNVLESSNITKDFNGIPLSPKLFSTSGNFYLKKNDIEGIWSNPASIFTKRNTLYFSHTDYLVDLKSENGAISFYNNFLSSQFALSYSYRYSSDIKYTSIVENSYKVLNNFSFYSTLLHITLSHIINKNFIAGITYKRIVTKVNDYKETGNDFNAGIIWKYFIGDINMGLYIKDILTDKFISCAISIPFFYFIDIFVGYDTDKSIGGFNISGKIKIKNFLNITSAYYKEKLKYGISILLDNSYEISAGFQPTDIDMIYLLSLKVNL